MTQALWFSSVVGRGSQLARTLGYPTLNLEPTVLPEQTKRGVYASYVRWNEQLFRGALYLGPRLILNETTNVLEIAVMDFSEEIYDHVVHFTLEKWIRPPQNFSYFEALLEQLKRDEAAVREALPAPESPQNPKNLL